MNAGRAARRLAGVVVHNWPLKLAAVVLASLMYAGLVASQDSRPLVGPLKITPEHQPANTVLNQLANVESIQYLATADVPRPRIDDFRATIDLADVAPDGNPVNVRVSVTIGDPRISVVDWSPHTVRVVLDRKIDKAVPVVIDLSQPPEGLTVGDVKIDPERITVSGPSALVNTVVSARIGATIDASALDIDREVQAQAVDANGAVVNGVELEPDLVHLVIPVIRNLDSRTVPVSPIVTGTPGAGFRIAGISVDPKVLTVEGDAKQLADLVSADTAPVMVSGATRDITAEVAYSLPTGVTPIGGQTARVTVKIEAVKETRTFPAGVRLDGRNPTLLYEPSDIAVLLTVFGSTADLDRLATTPIVISVNVAGLDPGTHVVQVVPSLSSVLTVAAIDPDTITVTVTPRPTPTPEPTPTPTPAPSGDVATPTPEPTPAP